MEANNGITAKIFVQLKSNDVKRDVARSLSIVRHRPARARRQRKADGELSGAGWQRGRQSGCKNSLEGHKARSPKMFIRAPAPSHGVMHLPGTRCGLRG
jgi:hypothetical protein